MDSRVRRAVERMRVRFDNAHPPIHVDTGSALHTQTMFLEPMLSLGPLDATSMTTCEQWRPSIHRYVQ